MSNSSAGPSSKVKLGSSQPSETTFKRKRGVFQKDCLASISIFNVKVKTYGALFAFNGDFMLWYDKHPLPESVTLVEDIVVEYVTDLVNKAQDVASKRGKLLTEDFLFLIRKDLPKLNRSTELLSMNEELKQARKAFEVDEEKLATID
ncbi:TBP-associated factor 13 [Actinidia rufa]|uniref:Transcription initiation factor TFIID subunit 13 n=1 Tax=Actinidia rufa TaxID=165716 RepID=A0A7J0DFQ2_9ERIC|nr:TBP-associated factor 13 [Actinidia rufa]